MLIKLIKPLFYFCCDALGSINVVVDEDEMVQICLGGLAQRYGPIRMAICTREKPPSFFDLQSMLMVQENHTKLDAVHEGGSPRGRVGRGGLVRNGGGREEQERRHKGGADNTSRPSTSKGIQGGAGNWQAKAETECW